MTRHWTVFADDGHVAMTAADVAKMAKFERTTPRLFAQKYARQNSGPLEGEKLTAVPLKKGFVLD